MNVVDSSGWLEYLADGPNADFFAPSIEDTGKLIVPSISIFEVFKKIMRERNEKEATMVAGLMVMGTVVDLDSRLSIMAARMSHSLSLPLADSIILATAKDNRAMLWTQDSDFKGLDGVQYIARKSGKQ